MIKGPTIDVAKKTGISRFTSETNLWTSEQGVTSSREGKACKIYEWFNITVTLFLTYLSLQEKTIIETELEEVGFYQCYK